MAKDTSMSDTEHSIRIDCPDCGDRVDAVHLGSAAVQVEEDGPADAWRCPNCDAEVWTDANGEVIGTVEEVEE